jgi:hypothetical protein
MSLLGLVLPTSEASATLAFEDVQNDTLAFQLQLLKEGEFSVLTDPTNPVTVIVAMVLGMQYVIGMGSFTGT